MKRSTVTGSMLLPRWGFELVDEGAELVPLGSVSTGSMTDCPQRQIGEAVGPDDAGVVVGGPVVERLRHLTGRDP